MGYNQNSRNPQYGQPRDEDRFDRPESDRWRDDNGGDSRNDYRPYGGRPTMNDRYDQVSGSAAGYAGPDRSQSRRGGGNGNYGDRPSGRNSAQGSRDYAYDDRGFFNRAGDEVRSWFGDEDAERRRDLDRRYDERYGNASDAHYASWRSDRIAELDRDYDEYRRENADKFHREFSSFRTDRETQRGGLSKVTEHMEVVGSDGTHVGTVDKVRGDRIILTKSDTDAGGRHHSIPSRWIDSVDKQVKLRKTADEAQGHWRDEERNGAMFGDADRGTTGTGSDMMPNRGFTRSF